ncbi:MAG: protein kinase [Myxococcaceae bacterium]|nr:protein kinase [Myxococcaceae bacterium]
MDHLDPNAMLDFMHGALAPEEAARAEEHIDGCVECQRMVMEALRTSTTPNPVERPPDDLRSRFDGEINIGRFTVLQYLGAGAMGVVYAAYDPKLDRKVALKLVRSRVGEADPRALEQLTAEARAMAKLSHANVVTVHEVGEFYGQVFIAMEYVTGHNLRKWLTLRPRSLDEVVRVFVQAGRGLAAAHRAGIVHRDFKPENVMVGEDNAVLVTDFGLARADGEDATVSDAAPISASQAPTRTGGIAGTPAYMAPEQLKGARATPQSDQFAFCVAFYEAIAGARPFEGNTIQRIFELMNAGPPSLAPLLRRVTPLRLQSMVLRGLAVDPNKRYPSMEALLNDLGRDPWLLRRRFMGSVLAVAAAASLVAGALRYANSTAVMCQGGEKMMGAVWSPSRRETLAQALGKATDNLPPTARGRLLEQLDGWARQWQTEYAEACAATLVRGEQTRATLDARMLCLQSQLDDGDVLVQVLLEADAKAMGRGLDLVDGMKPPRSCRSATARAPALSRADVDEKELSSLQRRVSQLQTRQELGRGGLEAEADLLIADLERADAKALLAEALVIRGIMYGAVANQPEEARTYYERARLLAMSVGHDAVAVQALSRETVALAYALGRPEDARALEPTLMALLERLGHPPELEAEVLARLSGVMALRGDTQESRRLADRSIALLEKEKPQSLALARAYSDAAITSQSEGDYADVLDKVSKAIAIRTAVGGPESRLLTLSYLYSSMANSALNRPDEAQRFLSKFEEQLKRYYAPGHRYLALVPQARAEALRRQGDFESALAALLESQAMLDASGVKQSAQRSQLDVDLALTYVEMGQYTKAEPFVERALAAQTQDKDTRSSEHGTALMLKGLVAASHKRFGPSVECLAEATAIFEKLNHPDRVLSLSAWAEVDAARGHQSDADAHADAVTRLPLESLRPVPGDRALVRFRLAKAMVATRPAAAKVLLGLAQDAYAKKLRPPEETARFEAMLKKLK